jgi:hypothetical protein
MYPNPADETLKIEWASAINPERIDIFNTLGQNVLSIKVAKDAKAQKINTKLLANGNYYASIISPDYGKISGEFMIAR